MINVIYPKKTAKCDIGRINDKGDIFKEGQENAILDVLMIKVIYSKKSGKCVVDRINDKGYIFEEVRKMRFWMPELMIKVIYSKKSGKCDIGNIQRSQENCDFGGLN